MGLILDVSLALLGLLLVPPFAYLLMATLLSGEARALAANEAPRRRFRFIVPAHDEAEGIGATVTSLLAVDYPKELFDVLVVADNCSDDTAARAEAAGARVLVRNNREERGKGYALALAFEQTPAEVDAVVVIDADTLVSANILREFALGRDAGAAALQADYAVRNPDAGWRTRLMAVALGCFHIVRSRARESLKLSCGLRGNGMCFSRALLAEVPHHAYSVVEDVEYGIRLGEAGYRVHYVDRAHVYGEMVSKAGAAASQRRRWEEGRRELVRRNGWRLFRAGLFKNRVLFDLSLDLLIPPLSRLALAAVLGFAVSLALRVVFPDSYLALAVFSAELACLFLYVLRGWSLSGTGLRGLADLCLAPVYVVWKMALRFQRPKKATSTWVRTEREQSVGSESK
jgi:cellulose synthase/poly-beta-1,6-N-acetylglucosamine synthase-like glycosyltransferase